MRLSKIHKKVAALALAAGIGVVACGTGAYADVTREPFNFSVSVGKNDTSANVQKTVSSSEAVVTVNSYGNTTDKNFLRCKVLRSSTVVISFKKVTGTGTYRWGYEKAYTTGQSFKLRGNVAKDAKYGYGVMAGIFQP